MQIDAKGIAIYKNASVCRRIFRVDRDIICRVEFFVILIGKVVCRILFRLVSGRVHHLIQVAGMRGCFSIDAGIKLRFRAFQFFQQSLCCQLCAPHIPVAVPTVIQLLFVVRQCFEQIHIPDILLFHLLLKQLGVPYGGCRIPCRHLTAIQGIFIGCDGKAEPNAVLFAVFLHQTQYMSGRITLPGCKGFCAGIVRKGAFIEQPIVFSQQHTAAVQRFEHGSGKLIVQGDHLMTEPEMIRKIIRKLIQDTGIEAAILFP